MTNGNQFPDEEHGHKTIVAGANLENEGETVELRDCYQDMSTYFKMIIEAIPTQIQLNLAEELYMDRLRSKEMATIVIDDHL